jgi:hypothetical protein
MKMGRRRRDLERALDQALAQDRQRRGRAGEHDVELREARRQVGERDRGGVEALGEGLAARERAVGHHHGAGTLGDEVGGGELDHLAHAHQQQAGARKVAVDVLGELQRRGRHRDRLRAQLRLGAHLLGHREGLLEERPSWPPTVPAPSATRSACFTWPRIWGSPRTMESRPGSDAEGVAHGRLAAVAVDVAVERDAHPLGGRAEPCPRRLRVLGAAIDLGAIAGRDQHRLRHAGLRHELGERLGLPLGRERELLAHVERRAVVIDAENVEAHGSRKL